MMEGEGLHRGSLRGYKNLSLGELLNAINRHGKDNIVVVTSDGSGLVAIFEDKKKE